MRFVPSGCLADEDRDGICDEFDFCPKDPVNACVSRSELSGHLILRHHHTGTILNGPPNIVASVSFTNIWLWF